MTIETIFTVVLSNKSMRIYMFTLCLDSVRSYSARYRSWSN